MQKSLVCLPVYVPPVVGSKFWKEKSLLDVIMLQSSREDVSGYIEFLLKLLNEGGLSLKDIQTSNQELDNFQKSGYLAEAEKNLRLAVLNIQTDELEIFIDKFIHFANLSEKTLVYFSYVGNSAKAIQIAIARKLQKNVLGESFHIFMNQYVHKIIETGIH